MSQAGGAASGVGEQSSAPTAEQARALVGARPLAIITVFLGTGVGTLLLRPPLMWLFLLQIAAIFGVLTVVLLLGPAEGTGAHERVLVFVLVLLSASGLAFAFERARSPAFDFAALTTDDGPVAGYYVTRTTDAVLLITLGSQDERAPCPADRSPRQITAVPNGQIQRLSLGPREVTVNADEYCKHSR
jgi:hypothetical protein